MFPRPWSVTGVRRRQPGWHGQPAALFLFVAGLVVGGLVIAPKTPLTRDPVLTDLAPTARPRPVSLVRVVDGDTFEARLRTDSGREVTTRIRLRSIDTPEFAARCRREYEMAQAARRALDGILAEGDIRIRSIGPDKYAGRIVAEASTRRTSDVSQAMIAAGHARRYAGGRRAGWC